jgi:hypothetical protein
MRLNFSDGVVASCWEGAHVNNRRWDVVGEWQVQGIEEEEEEGEEEAQ